VADRANERIHIFSPEGDFLGMWTGMGGPNDITRGKDGNFYIAEQEDSDKPGQVCVRNANGAVLSRMERRHGPRRRRRLAQRHLRQIDPGPQRGQVRARRVSANVSFVGVNALIVTGPTFISARDPYCY
jgi:hypothetical protein